MEVLECATRVGVVVLVAGEYLPHHPPILILVVITICIGVCNVSLISLSGVAVVVEV